MHQIAAILSHIHWFSPHVTADEWE